ncbi:uncharacterized protein M421DRAFT_178785 [Didymella exigua CBS 183.55]|uniref:Uncharacterized protein n=1 Tax=Didymella exigua CBS 183.55 TaxID=1150837 RepID=A0A6A5RGH1_9PLEO|nr:uncharacterized protein M421DRAFT_178785 [Didymella exigua CBS 183.55]KAF1927405.1 hypothetical protein M421DRAFT_178785 [Didymella exigua CBS 183.55]
MTSKTARLRWRVRRGYHRSIQGHRWRQCQRTKITEAPTIILAAPTLFSQSQDYEHGTGQEVMGQYRQSQASNNVVKAKSTNPQRRNIARQARHNRLLCYDIEEIHEAKSKKKALTTQNGALGVPVDQPRPRGHPALPSTISLLGEHLRLRC